MDTDGGKPRIPAAAPPWARLHIWQVQAFRDALLVAAIIALVWAGYAMRAVSVPLLVALTLAYLFEPLIVRLSRHGLSRPFAAGAIIATFGITLIVSLAIVIPLLIGQTVEFAEQLRSGRFHAPLLNLREYVPETYRADYERALSFVGLAPTAPSGALEGESPLADLPPRPDQPAPAPTALDEETIRQIVRDELALHPAEPTGSATSPSWLALVRGGSKAALTLLGAVAQLGLLAFLIPFYFFFFSLWFPSVVHFVHDLIPVHNRNRSLALLAKMDRAIAGFVRGRIVISALIGVMLAVGWAICGVPYAIPLGLLIGVFSAVPYLGGIGIPLAVGLLWFKHLSLPEAEQWSILWIIAAPVVVFLIVQVIETYILTPVIAGKATNLDPVTILVAVLAGGSVGGVYGMILAIPIAACAKILITDVLLPRIKAWTQGKAADPLPFDGG